MARINAETTLLKSEYFLQQAKTAEADPGIAADPERLPFAANLEAAIIYARSSADHLHAEFVRRYKKKGYRDWHKAQWETLRVSKPVLAYFAGRRDFIVHQEPEKTNLHVMLSARLTSVASSMSVNMIVTRADGSVELPNPEQLVDRQLDPGRVQEPSPQSPNPSLPGSSHQFFFDDADWRAKPAVAYVDEFIDAIRQLIADAKRQFT
jgi:hypothetical protein